MERICYCGLDLYLVPVLTQQLQKIKVPLQKFEFTE